MGKKYSVVVMVLLSALSNKLQAQTDSDTEMQAYYSTSRVNESRPDDRLKAAPGTYQIFILGEDSTQLRRTDLAAKIEYYRDENTVVHLKVSNTTTIRILPCSEITSTRFNPINNEVVFQPNPGDPSASRQYK